MANAVRKIPAGEPHEMVNLLNFYRAEFSQTVDVGQFIANDEYANRILTRAEQHGSSELRQLARNLRTARAQPGLPPIPAIKPAKTVAPQPERRAGNSALRPRELVLLATLRNLFHREFGVFFDAEEFAENDLYARSVLAQCVSANVALILKSTARNFLDAYDHPRIHRRNGWTDIELDLA